MKKTYSKPDIAFESFSLSTSIAGNCEVKTDTKAGGECGYPMDEVGWIFLIEMIGGCQVKITEEQSLKYNGFCYHVPTEKNNLFNS
jgi:hypothetical protein